MGGAAILARGLTKSCGDVRALRGVGLQAPARMMVGFLGPNGAGKTTTIRCLLDLIRPDGGEVRVLGLNPQQQPVEVRRRVGYLPGELNLEANLTVEQVLRYLSSLRGWRVVWAYARELAG